MKKACVIGAGLYGSQIATALEEQGYLVILIDDQRPRSGSAAAACLIKPEWVKPLGSAVLEPAFKWLRSHYKEYKPAWVMPENQMNGAFYYEPSEILRRDIIEASVFRVVPHPSGATVWVHGVDDPDQVAYHDFSIPYSCGSEGTRFEVKTYFDVVVVAAGYWTPELLKEIPNHGVKVTGKIGTALTWHGSLPIPSFVQPWAPYKQIVGLQRRKDFWLGDGSALLLKSYTDARRQESVDRCIKAVLDRRPSGIAMPEHRIDGIRPYTDDIHGVCRQVHPGIWAATGARKNGTILGAYCAQKIAKEVPC
jgi:glycine/D-amino acid oxidase-like deaminating enzyme